MGVIKLFRLILSPYRRLKKWYFTFYVRLKAAKTEEILNVNHRCYVSSNTYLGNNVNFNGIRISGNANVIIGDNFHSGYGCAIMSSYHNYDNGTSIPYDHTMISKDIIIGDNVWFGINVTILTGVNIGEGAIIQAGSVVVSDIPPLAIAGGHPAKVFKYRDENHYFSLKKENKFV